MENIIDFFSGKSLGSLSIHDYKKNDSIINDHGVYLGSLIKDDANKLRNLNNQAGLLVEQINLLTEQWEDVSSQHQHLLNYCLHFLSKSNNRIKSINLEKDEIMVSKDGHVWVIYNALNKDL